MPIPKNDFEMSTSRFSVQGGPTRDGVKCKLHPIGNEICLHLHDFYEIELVVTGSMHQSVNGVPFLSGEGDFVFMDLLSVQRIAKPTSPPSVWTLSISPGEADPTLTRLLSRARFPLIGTLPPEALAEFSALSHRLQEAMAEEGPYTHERVTALTVLLITMLFEHGTVPNIPAEEPRAYHYIQKALVCLNESFASPLTLSEVARRIHISPCYLSDLFSRIVGRRFVEYLTHLRLERAQAMLREQKISVAEVAAACGFGTVSNFTRAFHRAFGVAPSRWRHEEAEGGM